MLQTAAVVSKKLVVYSKITTCVKQLCLLGVMHKVSTVDFIEVTQFLVNQYISLWPP